MRGFVDGFLLWVFWVVVVVMVVVDYNDCIVVSYGGGSLQEREHI